MECYGENLDGSVQSVKRLGRFDLGLVGGQDGDVMGGGGQLC